MRRNPRPFRAVDRRKLAIEIIEREARAAPMSSPTAIEAARERDLAQRLSYPLLSLKPRK